MLRASDATLGPAIAWLLLCLAGWLSVHRWAGTWSRVHPRLLIMVSAAVARVVPALALDRGLPFDVEAHWWVGSLALAGQDVYAAPLAQARYPYPPLHMYVSALMVWLSGNNRTTFLIVDKLIPAVCGVGLALVVRALALRLGFSSHRACVLGLLYAVNPLPVLVTAYHGQLEEVPLLLIGVAFLLLLGSPQTRSMVALSGLLLGVAVAYKTWPLLFVPPLSLVARGPVRRVLYPLLALTPLAASIGLYGLAFGRTGMREAIHRMITYRGSTGFCWGYVAAIHSCWVRPARFIPNAWVLALNSTLVLVALLLAGLILVWQRRPLEGMVTLPLVFYLFSPGWGPNYSLWMLPFALLLSARLAMRYTIIMLPVVGVIYFDSLYAAYTHYALSWQVLKPLEAVLGLLGWGGVAVMVMHLYHSRGRQVQAYPDARRAMDAEYAPSHPIRDAALE